MKRECINRRGFTLIELIIVLAILAIIATIAVPRFVGMQDKAKERVLKTNCSYLYTMLAIEEMDYDENHRYRRTDKNDKNEYLSGCIELYLEEMEEGKYSNIERYKNPYSDAKNVYNWDNMNIIGYKENGETYNSAAVFITNDTNAKYSKFSLSDLSNEKKEMFEGVIIVYIDNESTYIEINYIVKEDDEFIAKNFKILN